MKNVSVVLGVIFLLLAVIVLVFATGFRRWYSGIFFAFIGIASLLNALKRDRAAEK